MDGPAFPTDFWYAPPASAANTASPGGGFRLFGKDGFSFLDLLDIVNPLQHIPVVSTIYRRISGDLLDPLPRVAGGALFGGITGVISAVANLVVTEATGKDIGAGVLALLENGVAGDDRSDPSSAAPKDGPGSRPESGIAHAGPKFTISAGWQAANAMPYCDAECLDPRRSFHVDAASVAAARYAETSERTNVGQTLDMQG